MFAPQDSLLVRLNSVYFVVPVITVHLQSGSSQSGHPSVRADKFTRRLNADEERNVLHPGTNNIRRISQKSHHLQTTK